MFVGLTERLALAVVIMEDKQRVCVDRLDYGGFFFEWSSNSDEVVGFFPLENGNWNNGFRTYEQQIAASDVGVYL